MTRQDKDKEKYKAFFLSYLVFGSCLSKLDFPKSTSCKNHVTHVSLSIPSSSLSRATIMDRRSWSDEEDQTLRAAVEALPSDWAQISEIYFHGNRNRKSCRSRWDRLLEVGLTAYFACNPIYQILR
jgi:hypothetical protein